LTDCAVAKVEKVKIGKRDVQGEKEKEKERERERERERETETENGER
jgi:hypothetical protein